MNKPDFMEFYYYFLNNSKIYNEFIKHIAFYGSSVPYMILQKEPPITMAGDRRKIKDIDTYIKVEFLAEFREYLLSLKDFRLTSDSSLLFRKDLDRCETDSNEYEIHNKNRHKNFGFCGDLYGMPISVYPIYEDVNIYSRGYKEGSFYEIPEEYPRELTDDERDTLEYYGMQDLIEDVKNDKQIHDRYDNYTHEPDYLINLILVRDYSLEDFIIPAKIFDKNVNVVCLEYMIASKEISLAKGNVWRRFSDEYDLNFLQDNMDKLLISREKTDTLRAKTICEIDKAYLIFDGYIVRELDKDEYEDIRLLRMGRIPEDAQERTLS